MKERQVPARSGDGSDALQHSYPDYYENSPGCLLSLDRNGVILRINSSSMRLLDCPERPIGRRFDEFLGVEERALFANLLETLSTTGMPQGGEFRAGNATRRRHTLRIEAHLSDNRQEYHLGLVDISAYVEQARLLRNAREYLENTLHSLPDMLFEVSLDGRYTRVGSSPLPLSMDASPRRLDDILPPGALASCLAALQEANATGHTSGQQCQFRVGNELKWFEFSITKKDQAFPDGPHFMVLSRDVSTRKLAEEKLQQQHKLYRSLARIAPLGVWSADADGKLTYINEWWQKVTGQSAGEALRGDWIYCIHPDDRQGVAALWQSAVASGSVYDVQHRLLGAGGGVAWVHAQGVPEFTSNGRLTGYFGLIFDISESKNERDALESKVRQRTGQLLAMAIELSTTEERERQALSHELHDGLAQNLAVAKLKLSSLSLPATSAHADARLIREVEALIDGANEAVRSLSLQLSPPLLNQFGLIPAVEWLASEIRRIYNLTVAVHSDDIVIDLDHTVLNQVFRATRELLINVAKHAAVAVADVSIICDAGCLTICVEDSGVGFDQNLGIIPSAKGGYGLFSVRQRIGFIGGDVQIDSSPGHGTVVVVTIPMEPTS